MGAGIMTTVSAPTKPKPPRSTVNVDALPAPLRGRDQWAAFRYGFRDGSWTKIPKQPNGKNAKSNDPSTWSSFRDALDAFEADPTLDGIGYIFAEDDPYCGVDIDKVKNDQERLAWALGIVRRFGTYAEWSVSGNGLHLIGEGRMPDAGPDPQKGRNDQTKGLEAYSRRRFFTFTGKVVEGATTAVVDTQEALDWLLANEFKPVGDGRAEVKLERSAAATPIGDRDQRARERMYAAKRGSEIQMLANGGSVKSKPEGGADVSGDDQSYANALAFWFDKDPTRIASEMWRSNRVRDKWNEVHSANGQTYLEMTIGKAISGCSQSFRDLRGYDAGDDPPSIGRIQFTVPETPAATDRGEKGNNVTISGEPTTLEEALIEIKRLQRRALDQDDRTEAMTEIIAVNQDVIAATRAERDALRDFVTTIDAVLANPDLTATDKVVSIVITRDLHTRLSQGRKTIALARIADQTGMHKNTVGKSVDRLSTGDGAPFEKIRKRNPEKEKELGHPVLDLYITPRGESARDTLAAVASYVAPEERPKRGASPKAAEHRWDRCDQHPTADVLMQGVCTDCSDVLGDRRISPDEFEGLKHTLGVSGIPPAPVDVLVPMEHTLGVLDAPPPSLLDYAASRPQEAPKPWKCHCGSLERTPRANGYRCDGCGQTVVSAPADAPMQGRAVEMTGYFKLPDDLVVTPGPGDPVSMGHVPCCRGVSGDGYGAWRNLGGLRGTCVTCGAELRWQGGVLKIVPPAAVAGGSEE
jgi:primase-polymerase (primpol)-like protein